MKPASQRALSFLISLALMIGAVVVYALFIVPSNTSMQSLRGQVINKQTELKQQEAALNDLNDLLEKFHDLNSAQDLMSFALPNDPSVAQIVNTLNGLANIDSIKIKSISLQSNINKSSKQPAYVQNIGTVKMHVIISGAYDNLKSFINHAEKNVRIMDISSFNIVEDKTSSSSNGPRISSASSTPASSQMIFAVNLEMQAYFQEALTSIKK